MTKEKDWHSLNSITIDCKHNSKYLLLGDTCNEIDYKIYDNVNITYNRNATETSTLYSLWREYDNDTTAAAATTSVSYCRYDDWVTYDGVSLTWNPPVVAPGDRIRQMIRDRMGPAIRRSRTSLSIAMDVREERARQTLRRIIGEQAFRKFVRDGFITVVPKSGLMYLIYPGHGITKVYDKGIMVDRLCVVLKGNFPPTDSILMRYLLILNDEGEFSKYAVKHAVLKSSRKLVLPAAEIPALTEAWSKMKVA